MRVAIEIRGGIIERMAIDRDEEIDVIVLDHDLEQAGDVPVYFIDDVGSDPLFCEIIEDLARRHGLLEDEGVSVRVDESTASLGMTKAQIAALWESLPDAYEIADTIRFLEGNADGPA